MCDAPGRATEAESRESAQCGLDVDENDSRKNPVLGAEGGGPSGTSPSNTLSSKAPAWSSGTPASPRKTAYAAAGRVEQIRPVTFNVPVLQQVQADAVPVEAQAGLEVADHYHGRMNASGHSTRG